MKQTGWQRWLVMAVMTLAAVLFCCGMMSVDALAADAEYVEIGGTKYEKDAVITSANNSSVEKGTITFKKADNILILDNVTLNVRGKCDDAITIEGADYVFSKKFHVTVIGENTITYYSEEDGKEHSGIRFYQTERAYIEGSGSLTLNVRCKYAIHAKERLFIDGTLDGPLTLKVDGVNEGGSKKYVQNGLCYQLGMYIDKANVSVDAGGVGIRNYDHDDDQDPLVIHDSQVIVNIHEDNGCGIATLGKEYHTFKADNFNKPNLSVYGNTRIVSYAPNGHAIHQIVSKKEEARQNYINLLASDEQPLEIRVGGSEANIFDIDRTSATKHYALKDSITGNAAKGSLDSYQYLEINTTTEMNPKVEVDFDLAIGSSRPDWVKVNLHVGGVRLEGFPYTFHSSDYSNFWVYTAPTQQVPVTVDGTIDVTVPKGYYAKVSGSLKDGYRVVVTGYDEPVPSTIDVDVKVRWGLNPGMERPNGIDVALYKNNVQVDETQTLDEYDDWTVLFPALLEDDLDQYTFKVEAIDSTYNARFIYDDIADGVVYLYVYNGDAFIDVCAEAVLKLEEGVSEPSAIMIELLQTNEQGQSHTVGTATLRKANNWQARFEDVSLLHKEQYSLVVRSGLGDYTYEITGDMEKGYKITVTGGTAETVTPKVTTTFDLAEGAAWPSEIKIAFYRDGKEVYTGTLTDDNGYQVTLPTSYVMYADQYRLEASIEDDVYHVDVDGDIEKGYTLTVCGGKEGLMDVDIDVDWSSLDEGAGKPAYIKVQVLIGDEVVEELTLDADNDWEETFRDLDERYQDEYELQIVDISDGYEAAFVGGGEVADQVTIKVTGGKVPTPNSDRQKAQEQQQSNQEAPCNHEYEWDIVRKATATSDGEMRYQCKYCGDVQYSVPMAAYYVFNKDTQEAIQKAAPGATVTVSTPVFISFHEMVKDALIARSDVTLVVEYRYAGKTYRMTIPADSGDTLENLFGDSQYAGFLYLGGMFATEEQSSDTTMMTK